MIEKGTKKELTQEDIDKMEEDEYVRKFYEDGVVEDKEDGDDVNQDDEKKTLANNKFALLEEVEA